MVELFESDIMGQNRKSSKGNQMKWLKDGYWYKADFTGYEGLAEYVVSALLKTAILDSTAFLEYQTEKIKYQYTEYLGCRSKNFLPEGWQMITLERLFLNEYGESLNKSIYSIRDIKDRILFLVNQVIKITGLQEFGSYVCNLMTIDALFLNEDRHTNNIAVLLDTEGKYQYCPVFDHGGCLLSDTTMDYPMGVDTEILLKNVEAKTFCKNFDEQLDVIEILYKRTIKFHFNEKSVAKILQEEPYYSKEVKMRVYEIVKSQERKYQYLFK